MATENLTTPTIHFEFCISAPILVAELLYVAHWSVLMTLAMLASLLIHECGHIFTAKMLGVRVKAIGLCLWGPFLRREKAEIAKHDALIALSGPLVSLALAGICVPAVLAHKAILWVVLFNILIGIANLLPIKGTDGYRAFKAI